MSSEKYCKWWDNQGQIAQEQYLTLAVLNIFCVIATITLNILE